MLESSGMSALILGNLDDLRRQLAPHLRHSLKAIAFGSVARGESDRWSDLDLLIVTRTTRPFLERFRDFTGLYTVWPRLDLLIYTPEEFDRMVAEENPLILQVLAEGVVVHQAA